MSASSNSSRLLLVEDDPIFADVLAGAMAARGYDCTTFHEFEQARDCLEKQPHPFAYAVLDLNLDGQSSLPLIEPLKTGRPDMRILVLTGYASIATAVEAVKLGADEYLTKPADADQIERALTGEALTAPTTEAPTQPMSVRRLEWEHLQRVLAECDGNISEAARRLNMHRRTLQRKLAKKPVAR